ncbi:MAG: Mov34/MPN/PAD-1 family protein [bacterium]
MEKLILNKENYYQIIKYCQEKKPAEACGIIAGEISEEKAEEKGVYYMKNIENSAEEYLMDPEEQFEVFRNIREKGWDLLLNFDTGGANYP